MAAIQPAAPHQIDAIRELMREYADIWVPMYAGVLGARLCLQGVEDELAGLPGSYAPPPGRLLAAWDGAALAGCVALRRLDDSGACEMKRLYVRSPYRGTGLGKALVERAIEEARGAGYRVMRLDTLPAMSEAIALYRRRGFREIPPYSPARTPGALYFELDLA